MTRVDFYILPENAGPAAGAVITACKLCDKASGSGSRVYVFAPGATADALDSALWSFRQGSFIGHERWPAALEAPLPAVLIGDAEPPPEYAQIMINLGTDIPPFFSRFERVLEIVDGDAEQRAKSRSRFKFYRDRGYELTTHNL
jgi:DNA polymerase III subunit chi